MSASPDNQSLLLLNTLRDMIWKDGELCFLASLASKTRDTVCLEAIKQHLGAFFYFYCHGKNLFSAELENKISNIFQAASAVELKRSAKLKSIFYLLEKNNIEVIPLKGAALAYTAYPHPALRTMSDFDLLIRPNEIDKAWKLFHDQNLLSTGIKTRRHMPLLFSSQGDAIEFHFSIFFEDNSEPEVFWKDTQRVFGNNQKIVLLSPELNLLHAMDHAFGDNLVCGFKVFLDAAFIIQQQKPDPDKLKKLAEKFGLYKKLAFFMRIFPEFFPQKYYCPLAEDIEANLENARYLILNASRLQQTDKHMLLLHREYAGCPMLRKPFFLSRKVIKSRKCIEYKYRTQMRFPVFAYYYSKEIIDQFRKFISYREKTPENDFARNAGIAQKKIQEFLNSAK